LATLILDTNLLFSALLRRDTPVYQILETQIHDVYVLEYATVEIFKHKEKILAYSKLTEAEIYILYHELLRMVSFFDENEITREMWQDADFLCGDVDPNDTVYVAAAMCMNGLVWTGDKRLRSGLEAKGFTRFRSSTELLRLNS